MVQSVYNERAAALLDQLRANQDRKDLIKQDLASAHASFNATNKANAVDAARIVHIHL